jgi:hypothetical protein
MVFEKTSRNNYKVIFSFREEQVTTSIIVEKETIFLIERGVTETKDFLLPFHLMQNIVNLFRELPEIRVRNIVFPYKIQTIAPKKR